MKALTNLESQQETLKMGNIEGHPMHTQMLYLTVLYVKGMVIIPLYADYSAPK